MLTLKFLALTETGRQTRQDAREERDSISIVKQTSLQIDLHCSTQEKNGSKERRPVLYCMTMSLLNVPYPTASRAITIPALGQTTVGRITANISSGLLGLSTDLPRVSMSFASLTEGTKDLPTS